MCVIPSPLTFQQLEGDTLAELSVAGHGVVLTLLSLLKQTTHKTEGISVGMYTMYSVMCSGIFLYG